MAHWSDSEVGGLYCAHASPFSRPGASKRHLSDADTLLIRLAAAHTLFSGFTLYDQMHFREAIHASDVIFEAICTIDRTEEGG